MLTQGLTGRVKPHITHSAWHPVRVRDEETPCFLQRTAQILPRLLHIDRIRELYFSLSE